MQSIPNISLIYPKVQSIEELENHLALTKNKTDLVKARRIIERIKQLTDDITMISVNLRK